MERLRAQRLAPRDAAAAPVEIVRHLIGLRHSFRRPRGWRFGSGPRVSTPAMCSGTRRPEDRLSNLADARNSSPRRRGRPGLAAGHPCPERVAGEPSPVCRRSGLWHARSGHRRARTALGQHRLPARRCSPSWPRASIPAGQRGIHLVRHAALHGLLICRPDQGHEQTWIRREVSTTQPVDDGEEALATLARRYHSAYGPAGPRDLAAWSGLRSPRHSAPGAAQVTCPGRRTVLAAGRQRSGCSRISIRICSATPVVTTRFLPGTGAGSGPAAGTCCRPWFATAGRRHLEVGGTRETARRHRDTVHR